MVPWRERKQSRGQPRALLLFICFPQRLSERKPEHRAPLTQQIYPKPRTESEKPTASQGVWFIISDGAALWSCATREAREAREAPSQSHSRCALCGKRPLRSPAGWTPALTCLPWSLSSHTLWIGRKEICIISAPWVTLCPNSFRIPNLATSAQHGLLVHKLSIDKNF